ncbi:MAG TPA: hypothetical protein VN043_13110 [Rhodanobacter sp.]|nr:hypothetical protein [Rhodanobacter sp.]
MLGWLFPQRKLLADIRSRWGRPGAGKSWRASAHFDLVRDSAADVHVDDKTWLDLEFPEIFARFDTTITPLGRQFLFSMMRTYVQAPRLLAERYHGAQALRSDDARRERIQLALATLRDDGYADVVDVVFSDEMRAVKYPRLLLSWSAVGLVALLGTLAAALPAWTVFVTVAINVIIIVRTFGSLRRDSEALKRCLAMLPVAEALARAGDDSTGLKAMARLRAQRPERKQVKLKLRGFLLFQNAAVQWVSIWLNITFLLELVAYAKAFKHVAEVRGVLQSTWALLGEIDAVVALACVLECSPQHCLPELSSAPLIDIEDGCHPLLANPACNSLRLDGCSALIAGSNMAGKTTMIKMVGSNIIIGRSLGFCLASRAVIPQSTVMASIRREHSVESGRSHYFGEIERLQTFIEYARQQRCRVFVIDELFSGTNTVERVAIARAVLEQLGADAQVLVTTHDVELQHDLAGDYELYHFQENPDIEGFFDYRLRPGAAAERNAIRLLGRVGFPAEIVARAMELVAGGSD